MYDKSERDRLIQEYRELLRQSREAETEEDRKRLEEMASQKSKEILICQFEGDKNIGRFNEW